MTDINDDDIVINHKSYQGLKFKSRMYLPLVICVFVANGLYFERSNRCQDLAQQLKSLAESKVTPQKQVTYSEDEIVLAANEYALMLEAISPDRDWGKFHITNSEQLDYIQVYKTHWMETPKALRELAVKKYNSESHK